MDVVRDTRDPQPAPAQRRSAAETGRRDAGTVPNAGSLTRTDVAQAQARLAAAQSDLTAAQSQMAISNANFLQAIGRQPETLEVEPALPPALPASLEDSITLALKQNPAASSVCARERKSRPTTPSTTRSARCFRRFSVQGQYGYSQGGLVTPTGGFNGTSHTAQHAVTVTGQLNVPIYQAGVEEATVRQAKELHAQAQLNIDVSDRAVRDAVAIAWAQFEAAEASIASNEAAVHANEIAFEGVSKEQQVGGRTILDVLNAEQELLNAQVALVTRQAQRRWSRPMPCWPPPARLTATGSRPESARSTASTVHFHDSNDSARGVGFPPATKSFNIRGQTVGSSRRVGVSALIGEMARSTVGWRAGES